MNIRSPYTNVRFLSPIVVLTVDRSNAGFHDKRCCSVSSFNFEVHHTYEYVATGGGCATYDSYYPGYEYYSFR